MVIRKFVNGSRDGRIDVHYQADNEDVKRLASSDYPRKELEMAMEDLLQAVGNFCGVEPSSFHAILFSRDMNEVSFKIEFGIEARNEQICKITSPRIEYIIKSDETIQTFNQVPIELAELSRELESRLEEYINGERSQQELQFQVEAVNT